MSFQPEGWAIVLAGRWNPAILSPAGIAKHIFHLPPAVQIQVKVPLDGVSAYLVSNPTETLVAHAALDRLQIDVVNCKFQDLIEGLQAGRNALEALPITPILAVGFNLNYKSANFETGIAVLVENEIEKRLRSAEYSITGNTSVWSFPFKDGQINLTIITNENETRVSCNFHLGTTDIARAKTWLSLSEADIKTELTKISGILNLPLGERE